MNMQNQDKVVIVAGARTAVGKFGGSLKEYEASDLGAFAIKAALFKVVCMVINGSDRREVRRSCFSDHRHGKSFFLWICHHATTGGGPCQSLTGAAPDGMIPSKGR